jgi:preprotein translocase subunit YajC
MQNLNAILFPLLLLAVFWFLLIRPQRRQMQARARMQSSLQPGDDIITAGGLIATIRRLDGDTITIELSPGNEARIDRRYIAGKRNPPAASTADDGTEAAGTAEPDGQRDQR